MVEIINIFVQKDYLKQRMLQAENDVKNVCWYCKSCERCRKDVLLWNVYKDRFRVETLKNLYL